MIYYNVLDFKITKILKKKRLPIRKGKGQGRKYPPFWS